MAWFYRKKNIAWLRHYYVIKTANVYNMFSSSRHKRLLCGVMYRIKRFTGYDCNVWVSLLLQDNKQTGYTNKTGNLTHILFSNLETFVWKNRLTLHRSTDDGHCIHFMHILGEKTG